MQNQLKIGHNLVFLYNAEVNETKERGSNISDFGNSQEHFCDFVSSVTITPPKCQKIPEYFKCGKTAWGAYTALPDSLADGEGLAEPYPRYSL